MVWSDITLHSLWAHSCKSQNHFWSVRWVSNHNKKCLPSCILVCRCLSAKPIKRTIWQLLNAPKTHVVTSWFTALWNNNVTELFLRQIHCQNFFANITAERSDTRSAMMIFTNQDPWLYLFGPKTRNYKTDFIYLGLVRNYNTVGLLTVSLRPVVRSR